jgi:hypothetical protein
MVRQGDVLLVPVETIPETAKPVARDRGRVILAYGEVTGHAHAVADATAVELRDGDQRYLRVPRPVTLRHEEHGPIDVRPGSYRIVIQREYVPSLVPATAWRRVID